MDQAIFGDDLFTMDGDGNDISVEVLRTVCNDYAGLNPLPPTTNSWELPFSE